MAFIFSDVDAHLRHEGVFEYCKVNVEKEEGEVEREEVEEDEHARNMWQGGKGGVRSFIFLLRRYNLDLEKEVYSPGSWTVGETLGEIASKGDNKVGLTSSEVKDLYRVVARNRIVMDKPSYLRSVRKEFIKPFYLYQVFLVWTWFPLYYYYMAMIIAFTITLSAFTVAAFHYRNLRNLYKITHISGDALVLRDGAWKEVDQTSLVPGDLVKLAPGVTYCDIMAM